MRTLRWLTEQDAAAVGPGAWARLRAAAEEGPVEVPGQDLVLLTKEHFRKLTGDDRVPDFDVDGGLA